MNKYSKGVVYRVAVFICTATLLISSNAIGAERDIINRINRLENEIQTVNRAIFKDRKGRFIQKNQAPSSIAAFDNRLNNIEEDNREIINKLEKLNYDMRMLKDDIKKMQIDYNQRFQELSSNNKTVTTPKTEIEEPLRVTKQKPVYKEPVVYKHGNAEKLYNKAFSEIKGSNYDEAEKSFEAFIAQYPDHQLAPNSYYWLGETYYVRGNYKKAAKSFARCFQKYPDSSKALDSLLKLGLSLSTLGKTQDACLSFVQLQKQSKNPNSPINRRAVAEFKKLDCQ